MENERAELVLICVLLLRVAVSLERGDRRPGHRAVGERAERPRRRRHQRGEAAQGQLQVNKGIRDAGSTADFRILFEIFEILEILIF